MVALARSLLALQARGWNGPCAFLAINLGANGADRVARPRRGQDRIFQRPGAKAVPLAELAHELGKIRVGQGFVVLDRCDLRLCREQMVEMPGPARGVVAAAKLQGLGAIEDLLDTSPHPAGGLCF